MKDLALPDRADIAAIWRCGVGDAVEAVDVLFREWRASKRKWRRDAASELDPILQAVHDARMLCGPTSYAEALEAGKLLRASAIEAQSAVPKADAQPSEPQS